MNEVIEISDSSSDADSNLRNSGTNRRLSANPSREAHDSARSRPDVVDGTSFPFSFEVVFHPIPTTQPPSSGSVPSSSRAARMSRRCGRLARGEQFRRFRIARARSEASGRSAPSIIPAPVLDVSHNLVRSTETLSARNTGAPSSILSHEEGNSAERHPASPEIVPSIFSNNLLEEEFLDRMDVDEDLQPLQLRQSIVASRIMEPQMQPQMQLQIQLQMQRHQMQLQRSIMERQRPPDLSERLVRLQQTYLQNIEALDVRQRLFMAPNLSSTSTSRRRSPTDSDRQRLDQFPHRLVQANTETGPILSVVSDRDPSRASRRGHPIPMGNRENPGGTSITGVSHPAISTLETDSNSSLANSTLLLDLIGNERNSQRGRDQRRAANTGTTSNSMRFPRLTLDQMEEVLILRESVLRARRSEANQVNRNINNPAHEEEASSAEPIDFSCCICWERQRSRLLLPCRHLKMCKICCDKSTL